MIGEKKHAPRPGALTLASAAGLRMELNADGGLRRIRLGDLAVNLFMGNGMEPAPANVWVRLHRGGAVEAAPLLGPGSPLRPCAPGPGGAFRSRGTWRGLHIELQLVLADARAAWCWQVALENGASAEAKVDLVHAQDLGLTPYAGIRQNEYYVSQYLDLTPLAHPRCGWAVAARQNLALGDGRHPWAVVGSVRRACSYATDALQLHGLSPRMGGLPEGLLAGLPGERLQHEHALAAVQDEAVALAPGGRLAGGFFAAIEEDHPEATSAGDLAAVEAALSWAASLPLPPAGAATEGLAPAGTLFARAPVLACQELGEAELRRLFGAGWRQEERDGGGLLSFFCQERSHVVLRAKEARTRRPHGHILRTALGRLPDEQSLTSTAWMAGVFHSMVTQGHVSINRFLSTTHSWLSLFRSHGLRLFVQVEGGWQLLGVPSAFEMRPEACRWIYRSGETVLEVVSAAEPGPNALRLRARVLEGPPVAWLATLHLALGGDDGNAEVPVPWRAEGREVVVPVPHGSDLHARFPRGAFAVIPHEACGAPLRVLGDERLFTDGQSRGLPFLCLESEPCGSFGLDLQGRLLSGPRPDAAPWPLPELRPSGAGPEAEEVRRLAEMLPWLLDDALVHYLAPRGLEQYSGGGWGTRDACQGPLEMMLALDCPEAARELLLRVFAAQNESGDWPQWFQFIERERHLRADHAHGDIVFWPVLGAARYLLATGDAGLLLARVPFHAARPDGGGEAPTVMQHLERALELIGRRRVADTALAAYGHGDWNDSLQPADPSMRDRLCSAWTVTLHHQTLTTLARALRQVGRGARATLLEAEADRVRRDFRALLMGDGVIAGYGVFGAGAAPELLLHPRDGRTGIRYSLLPMMHAILEGLCTAEEAGAHRALMREHLWGPDGARLFDRPLPYRGGVERLFQRAETAAFFGREVGVMYTHAHVRYAQMLAHVGDAEGLLRAISLAHPVALRERLPQASLRQANCYYSSSDAAFRDRYQALAEYGRVAAGTVALDGGWRVYSSGPGILLALVVTGLLGVRRDGDAVVIDPVIAPALDGLRAEVQLVGRRLRLEVRVAKRGHGPQAVALNGRPLPFTRLDNPYRTGGAAIPLEAWRRAWRGDEPDDLRVELG